MQHHYNRTQTAIRHGIKSSRTNMLWYTGICDTDEWKKEGFPSGATSNLSRKPSTISTLPFRILELVIGPK